MTADSKTKVQTLKASSDFQRIAKQGRRYSSPAFFLQALRSDIPDSFILGLTASRKVGNAVVRNRAKRRLREMVRISPLRAGLKGWKIVLIAKTAATSYDFAALHADFEKGLRAVGVLT